MGKSALLESLELLVAEIEVELVEVVVEMMLTRVIEEEVEVFEQ